MHVIFFVKQFLLKGLIYRRKCVGDAKRLGDHDSLILTPISDEAIKGQFLLNKFINYVSYL